MSKKQWRADLPCDTAQIAVGPGRKDVPVAAGLWPVAIPGDAETIAIGGGLCACGAMGLLDQGMGG